MQLLALLNPPFGSRLAYSTDPQRKPERYSDTRTSTKVKTEISNSKQLEQNSSQNWPRRWALSKPCIPSDSAIRNDDALRKLWLGGSDRGERICLNIHS